jgi:hypothetical protein
MIITGEPKEVAAAYIKARSEIQSIMPKDAKGVHNSRYTTLASIVEAITPTLISNKLVLMQEPTTNEFGVAISTSILHESGASIDFGPLTMPLAKNEPQAVGSAISYARRYALVAVLGLASDDDDGQAAQDTYKAKTKQPAPVANGYHDDELWEPSGSEKKPATLSQAQLQRIHILGRELHGKAWATQGPALVDEVSNHRAKSSKELIPQEADVLIRLLESEIKHAKNGKVAA